MSTGLALDNAAWDSPWRTRSVRDKSLLSLGLVLLALVLPPWPGTALVAVTAVVALLGFAKLPLGTLGRCLWAPATFIALGAASVAITLTWDGGPRLGLSQQSLTTAATLAGHGLAGTLAVLVLAATTPMVDLLAALRRARVPDACVEIAALVYRILFALLDSVRAIREAQTNRLGYSTRTATMRSAAGLTGAVLLRAWNRAQRLEEGLAGRGYVDSLRTLEPELRGSSRFLVISILVLAAVAASTLVLARVGS